jgi:hypothetical protein
MTHAAPARRPLAARLGRALGAAALVAVLAWAALVAHLWFRQESLLFHPEPLDPSHAFSIPDLEEDWIDVPGARLHAIHYRQPEVDGVRRTKGLVFFLHGNAGNLASWFIQPAFWRATGYDLYMLDYRGFGKSTGHIASEAELHADVLAAWRRVAPEYAALKTVVYGRSLGTGLAVQLAATVQPDLLVLVSPYASMTSMKDLHYPWLPDAALRYPLASDRVIGRYRGPTLVFHGLRDTLIPPQQAQQLIAHAEHPQLVLLPQADHVNVHEDPLYRQALLARLAAL